MKKIIFATSNEGKMKEIRMILSGLSVEVLSMKEAGITADIEENGETFEENAIIKAEAVCRMTGEVVLADDSGLEIDCLNKAPGVHSARYMGHDTPYEVKNRNILEMLQKIPEAQRTARFVCAVAAACPGRKTQVVRGTIEGEIGYEAMGANGFGYDPIFYLPEYHCSTAELPAEEKNKISHRGEALRKIRPVVEGFLGEE